MDTGGVVFVVIGVILVIGGAAILGNARHLSSWANNLERPWRSNVRNTPALWVVIGLIWAAIGTLGIILPILHN